MHISKERFNNINNNNNNNNNNIISNDIYRSSKMKKLYKEIKEEIKNIVITKLHNQVQKLIKELNNLNKENVIIKNDLIYILKRIINNKAEYNNVSTIPNNTNNNFRNNSCINLNTSISPNNGNSSSIMLNRSLFSSEVTANCNSNSNFNNRCTSRTKISIIKTQENLGHILDSEQSKYFLDVNKFKTIDNKIDSYLNSLYKHNCIGNHIGYENNYNLNKTKGLYDELFNTQSSVYDNSNNNNYNNYNNYKSGGTNHKSQKRINISIDEKIGKGKSNSIKKFKKDHKFKNIILYNHKQKKLHNKTVIDKKDEGINGSSSCRYNKEKKFFIKDKDNGMNKNENGNNICVSTKNSHLKMKSNHTNRSPFLVNKF